MKVPVDIRYAIILSIVQNLFQGENSRLEKTFLAIHEKHLKAVGQSEKGFIYNGRLIYPKNLPTMIVPRAKRKCLHISLMNEFKEYEKDFDEVRDDKQYVKQTLQLVMAPTEDAQDIRDALPECCVRLVPQLSSLPRTREEGFTLTDPIHVRQFNEMVEKIEFYSVTNMIF